MKKSIDQLANATARQAQSEMAMMQRDIRALRDNLSQLSRGIRAPVIRTPRHVIKGSTSAASPLIGLAGIGLAGLIDSGVFADIFGDDVNVKAGGKVNVGGVTFSYSASQRSNGGYDNNNSSGGGSFYTSDAQSSSSAYDALASGQRVR